MTCCTNFLRQCPANYIFLLIFTLLQGVVLGFFCATYRLQTVLLAGCITALVFLGLTLFACCSTDFTGYAPYLFMALVCLSLYAFVISVCAICHVYASFMYWFLNIAGVLVFSSYIVLDTQMIL